MSPIGEPRRFPLAAQLGEAPVWCARSSRLWLVDIRGPAVHRLDPSTGAMERFAVPELVGMAVLANGGLLIGQAGRLCHFDPDTGAIEAFVTLDERPGMRVNDAKVAPDGTLWIGTMRDGGGEAMGSLYRVDAAGAVTIVMTDITTPNALAFSPNGQFVYFADTAKGVILRGPAAAQAPDFAPFAAADIAPGNPDGATVDEDGHLWVARYGAGAVARITPDGQLDATVKLPASQPTSCAFGGPGRRTLFITTARQRLAPTALETEPMAGDVFALPTEVAGREEPVFGG